MDISKQLYDNMKQRHQIQLPLRVSVLLDYQEHSINTHGKTSFSICGQVNVFSNVDHDFIQSFQKLDLQAKIEFYLQDFKAIKRILDDSGPLNNLVATLEGKIWIYSGLIGSWNPIYIKVQPLLLLMDVQMQDKKTDTVSLTHFMIRKSKNKDKKAWVLIFYRLNRKVYRMGCNTEKEFSYWYDVFSKILQTHRYNHLSTDFKQPALKGMPGSIKLAVDQLMDQTAELQDIPQSTQQHTKETPDIASKLVPVVDFQNFFDVKGFHEIQGSKGMMFQHNKRPHRLRLHIQISLPLKEVVQKLSNPKSLEIISSMVHNLVIKRKYANENLQLVYFALKSNHQLFKDRDFLFLRHICQFPNGIFIIDRSIDSQNHPPFVTIIRGRIDHFIIGCREESQKTQCVFDMEIHQQGYLSLDQNFQMSKVFLDQFRRIQQKFTSIPNNKFFNTNWKTSFNSCNQLKNRRLVYQQYAPYQDSHSVRSFHQEAQDFCEGEDFVSIMDSQDQHQQEDLPEPCSIFHKKKRIDSEIYLLKEGGEKLSIPVLDKDGFTIIDQEYLFIKHPSSAKLESEKRFVSTEPYHFVWRGEWEREMPEGGLKYVDEHKMAEQRGVIKYILNRIGKNILEGKPITQISLPVDIFCPTSNLQRIARSFGLAPHFLNWAAESDPLLQFKLATCWFISHQITFIEMDKPFNPILGQTFQGWIYGCPIYMEQISHHPPIHSLLMLGRQWTIQSTLQATISLKLNSGSGTFVGDTIIKFKKNGTRIVIRGNSGELSGLTFGHRRFNFVGLTRIFDKQNRRALFIKHNPDEKGFFSFGKQETPSDFLRGRIQKAKADYFSDLNENYDIGAPDQSLVQSTQSQMTGEWPKYLKFDDQVLYEVDKEVPYTLDYEKYPLASDCNYREDVVYRRLKNTVRSQQQKERLQEVQRNDRKLRKEYGPPKKH